MVLLGNPLVQAGLVDLADHLHQLDHRVQLLLSRLEGQVDLDFRGILYFRLCQVMSHPVDQMGP
jgi:hypothetical protein